MGWIILVVILIGLILAVWEYFNVKHLAELFQKCNTLTFGAKGSGKDVVFQKVINFRKKPYYAIMPYGGKYTHLDVKDVNVSPNTYENFIKGNTSVVKKTLKENMDFYISDAGVILPSHYDGLLSKEYPSFPIAYALSRQLWHMNIHMNTQAIDRPWIKLREQADSFIKARGCLNLGFALLVFFRTFEKKKSADMDMSPMGGSFLNAYGRAESKVYVATYGKIKNGWFLIRKKKIAYDTRYFHYVLFGERAPKKTKRKPRHIRKVSAPVAEQHNPKQ